MPIDAVADQLREAHRLTSLAARDRRSAPSADAFEELGDLVGENVPFRILDGIEFDCGEPYPCRISANRIPLNPMICEIANDVPIGLKNNDLPLGLMTNSACRNGGDASGAKYYFGIRQTVVALITGMPTACTIVAGSPTSP